MRHMLIENQKTRELVETLELLLPGTPLREGKDILAQMKTTTGQSHALLYLRLNSKKRQIEKG